MEMTQASIVGSELETTTAIAVAEPNQELCKVAQLSTIVQAVVRDCKTIEPTQLAIFTRNLVHHSSTASEPLLRQVKHNFEVLPRKKVDGKYPEVDGAKSFNKWLELHKIPKRTAYYILNGNPKKMTNKEKAEAEGKHAAPWMCKSDDGTKCDVVFSIAHDCVRQGDEDGGLYWIRQLYFAGFDVWKQLLVYASEDIGLADLTVTPTILTLEQSAKRCNDGAPRHTDFLMVTQAMMICCRAKKSRAVDDAIIWYNTHPTYETPSAVEVKRKLAEVEKMEKPPIADRCLDKHTGQGNAKKRGMTHFLTEKAILVNESDVVGFTPPTVTEATAPTVPEPEPPTPASTKPTKKRKSPMSPTGHVHIAELPPEVPLPPIS